MNQEEGISIETFSISPKHGSLVHGREGRIICFTNFTVALIVVDNCNVHMNVSNALRKLYLESSFK